MHELLSHGARLDSNLDRIHAAQGDFVKYNWRPDIQPLSSQEVRNAERYDVVLAGRLTWKDERGAARFVSVVTRNVSALGAFVECRTPVSIPLYRLVQFQLERSNDEALQLPSSLRQGRVLSAVYRVTPATKAGAPQGLALRLLVDPRRLETTRQEAQAASA